MTPRTTRALAMRPTGNTQGGFYFYSLTTGRLISRNRWTELPMPAEVIERVHTLARRANAARGPLAFLNRFGLPIADANDATTVSENDPDDVSFVPEDDLSDDDPTDDDSDDDYLHHDVVVNDNGADAVNAGVDAVDANVPDVDVVAAVDFVPPDADDIRDVDPALNAPAVVPAINVYDDVMPIPADPQPHDRPGVGNPAGQDLEVPGVDAPADQDFEIPGVDILDEQFLELPGVEDVPPDVAANPDGANQNEMNHHMDEAYGERTGPYNLFTQHSVKKGLKLFGDAGAAAVIKELNQLHTLKVITPVAPNLLSKEDKAGALQYLMFLKEKRCGTIKGHGCADGRKQRTYMTKEDTSSTTVAIKSVFLSLVIDADEQRDVATVDIPGAFLHADMDDKIYMRIDGDMARMLVNIAPDTYEPFLTYTKGNEPIIYVLVEKALYGTLKAALLFWEKLSNLLISWGFVINPYD
jgi:hypothetical protein